MKLPRLAWRLLPGAAVLLAGCSLALGAEPLLTTNQPAPSLEGARWFRGGPLQGFATGQLYVVEFRSPTNAAARAAIPTVAALASKYSGRAGFISVNLAVAGVDEEKRAADLAAFVRDQGPRLSYAVAADTADGRLGKAWLQASGRTNLPVAFVVGKDGNLAWIGSPARGLDEVLMKLGAAALPGVTIRPAGPELELRRRVSELRRAGKIREALAAVEEASANDPLLARSALPLRMSLLFQLDPAAAGKEARKLADGLYRNDPPMLSVLGSILIASREPADKTFGLTLAERACQQTDFSESGSISALARAQAANGNPAKAVETLETFARKVESSGGAGSRELRSIQSEITRYRKEAGMPPLPPSQPEQGESLRVR